MKFESFEEALKEWSDMFLRGSPRLVGFTREEGGEHHTLIADRWTNRSEWLIIRQLDGEFQAIPTADECEYIYVGARAEDMDIGDVYLWGDRWLPAEDAELDPDVIYLFREEV